MVPDRFCMASIPTAHDSQTTVIRDKLTPYGRVAPTLQFLAALQFCVTLCSSMLQAASRYAARSWRQFFANARAIPFFTAKIAPKRRLLNTPQPPVYLICWIRL